jgi:excinuclease ABC subunit A
MSVDQASEFFQHQPRLQAILESKSDVGLGYLRLGQPANTLSGGEAQRLKLASELSAAKRGLSRVLILDEPTTGLHAKDTMRLMKVLQQLASNGHAVVMIEHDPAALAACDRLIELGPDGGEAGGYLVAQGSSEDLQDDPRSPTGPWLRDHESGGQDPNRAVPVGSSAT